jgi:hypothetical protein
MSAHLARTADGWWAVTLPGLVRLDLPAATTAGLLADRAHLAAAVEAAHARQQDAVPAESLDLVSPVTGPARVVAQAVNYRSHAIDSGFDPDAVPAACAASMAAASADRSASSPAVVVAGRPSRTSPVGVTAHQPSAVRARLVLMSPSP